MGIFQSAKPYEDYKINRRKFDFKPSELTAIIISHANADHFALLPKLFHDGANCDIYLSSENLDFMKPMLEDSAKILERDVQAFNRKLKREHNPVYTLEDVNRRLTNILNNRRFQSRINTANNNWLEIPIKGLN